MASTLSGWLRSLLRADEVLASSALVLMTLIPLVEIALRPLLGRGIESAPVLVQHLGLVLAMFGAVAAERHGHLTTLGSGIGSIGGARLDVALQAFAKGSAALICGLLAQASWRFVASVRVLAAIWTSQYILFLDAYCSIIYYQNRILNSKLHVALPA